MCGHNLSGCFQFERYPTGGCKRKDKYEGTPTILIIPHIYFPQFVTPVPGVKVVHSSADVMVEELVILSPECVIVMPGILGLPAINVSFLLVNSEPLY